MSLKRLSLLIVLALAGCGGGSAPKSTNGLAEYLARDSPFVAAIDVDLAREEAQLDKDFDVLDVSVLRDQASTEAQVVTSASDALAPLRRALTFARDDDPVLKAFDGTKISGAASDGGVAGPVTNAIRTSQPFSDIADALEKAGWKRDGDAVAADKGTDITQVTDAGDGVVLLTGKGVDAAALADDPPGGPATLKAVFGTSQGSIRFAAFLKGDGCIRAIGGWETAYLDVVTMRVVVDGKPNPDAVDTKALFPSLVGKSAFPYPDDHLVEIPFSVQDKDRARVPLSEIIKSQSYRELYDCAAGAGGA